ncbi:helix-turn-helix transcriptional regulator [Candidatus Poribacteria bacterium]|nr:helix-turn-helix transcriptional regulator [Candidatus Poribacteria bacterium]
MSRVQIDKRIASRRRELGLSQADLARKLEVDPSYISMIESGQQEPSLEFLKRAAEVLDVKPSYLIATDAEIEGGTVYSTEAAELLARFQQLTEEDKKSLADFLRFLLEQKRKKDERSEATE